MSFRFTTQDFRDCRRNKYSLRRVRDKFKKLEVILLKRLPSQFNDLKKLHYVCKIRGQGGGPLREEIWLGMANGRLYSNPRKGIQYQVGIDSDWLGFNGIWIQGAYDARQARLEAAGRIIDKRVEFTKALKRLGAGFSLWLSTSEKNILVKDISEADIDELIDALPRYDTYVHIGKYLSRMEVIALGDNIVNEILKTAKKLLPIYRLLSESKVKLVGPKSKRVPPNQLIPRRVPSTQLINESSTWGMKIVKEFEFSEGRKPFDVSGRAEGYDIRSEDKKGNVRYIEVKSRRGGFRVSLTKNEFNTATEKGNTYYLYVVRGDGSIRIIKNPVKKCDIMKIRVLEFEVCDWVRKGKVYHNVQPEN